MKSNIQEESEWEEQEEFIVALTNTGCKKLVEHNKVVILYKGM